MALSLLNYFVLDLSVSAISHIYLSTATDVAQMMRQKKRDCILVTKDR
jgi:hypothetical protein